MRLRCNNVLFLWWLLSKSGEVTLKISTNVIAKDIDIANQNICKSFFHFYVERTGVSWPKSVLKSAPTTICSYNEYNISVVEEEFKLRGIAWALNTLITEKVKAEYPQISSHRAEINSDDGWRIKVTLFFELKLNKFQSL